MIAQYKRLKTTKQDVNTRRYNRIVIQRKLRIASFISAPRLVKGFHNHVRSTSGNDNR